MKKAKVNEARQAAISAVKKQKTITYVKKKITITHKFFETLAKDKAFQSLSLTILVTAGLHNLFSTPEIKVIIKNSVPLTEDQIKQVLDLFHVEGKTDVIVENNFNDDGDTWEIESKEKILGLQKENERLKFLAKAGGVVLCFLLIAFIQPAKAAEVFENVLNNSGQ